MASGINDQDLVSEARRFDECGSCGEVVRMRQEKLVCLECTSILVILIINKNRVLFVGLLG